MVDDIFSTNVKAAMRWSTSGTHANTLWGLIPPTKRKISWKEMHFIKIKNSKIVAIWVLADITT
jgi:predicted ester cyclase